MAITVIQAPGSFAGSILSGHGFHNPLWHVVSSTNVLQPDFRYVFDITIDGTLLGPFGLGLPITTRLLVTPDATTGEGRIDLSRIVRSYCSNYFDPRGTSQAPYAIKTDGIMGSYKIQYGEQYAGATYAALEEDGHFVFNTYSGDTPGAQSEKPAELYFKAWLTTQDINQIVIPATGGTFLSYLNVPNGESLKMRVNIVSGGLFSLDHDTTPAAQYEHLLVVNLNHEYINAAYGSPILTANDNYRVALFTSGGTQRTAWAYVSRMCEPKTPVTTLHFLNRLGGFDTYHFAGPTRKTVEMERKTFQTLPAVASGGVVREYSTVNNVYADTTQPFNTNHTWGRRLSSGYVDDTTHEWLWQLVASPQVYLEIEGYYYPVTIKTQQWTEKKVRFDKMYNLEIEIVMGRKVASQTR